MIICMMDDCTWYIGESVEACVEAFRREMVSDYETDDEYPLQLDDDALDTLLFHDTNENEKPVGQARTFREQLAIETAEGGVFPRLFAAMDY